MPDISNDAWIDLCCLVQSSYIENDKLMINYQYPKATGNQYSVDVMYHLRRALRAVGHTITSMENIMNCHHRITWATFSTTISEDESLQMIKLYNEWIRTVENVEN